MTGAQYQEALLLAPVVPQEHTAADVSPALVLQYVPNLGSGAVSVSVQVLAAGLRFKVAGDTPSGADAIGNSSGWILFATYTNGNLLLGQINKEQAYRAYGVDLLPGDLMSHLLVAASAQIDGANGQTLLWDSSLKDGHGTAISGEKFLNNGVNGWVKDDEDDANNGGCENWLLYGAFNVASDGELQFHSALNISASTQLGPTVTISTDTLAEVGSNEPSVEYLRATRGQRLVIRIASTTAGQAATPTRFHVLGKTVVLSNDRVVNEDNY